MSDNKISRKTPFIPRHDDEIMLWEVKEITAESDSKYKVTWAGVDPQNGRPWEPSWVSKADCTDLAVTQWEAKKKGKVKSENPGSGNATSTSGCKSEQQVRLVVKRKRLPESEDTRDVSTKSSRTHELQIPPRIASTIKIGPPRGAKRKDRPKQTATGPSSSTCLQKSSCVKSSIRVRAKEEAESSEDNSNRPQEALSLSASRRLCNATVRDFEPYSFPSPNDGHVKAGFGPEESEQTVSKHPSMDDDPITTARATSLSPSTHVSLEVFDGMGEPDSVEPPEVPEVSAIEVVPLQKEDSDSGVPASRNRPDLEGLLAKVEEIKHLQCTISIAANAALKLGMEAIQVIDAFQEDHRAEKK